MHQKHYEEVRYQIAQTNAHGNVSDPIVVSIFKEIVGTLKWEREQSQVMGPIEILITPKVRRRLVVGTPVEHFSCIAGSIIASY